MGTIYKEGIRYSGAENNLKELTKAEYDALPIAEKKNGMAYFVKDAEPPQPVIETGDVNYTFDERVVGTWVDGKPIYQKTWAIPETTITGGSWNRLPEVIKVEDTDVIVGHEILLIKTGYHYSMEFTGFARGHFNGSDFTQNGCFSVFSPSDFTTRITHVTIRYTKTTD